jgi:squalene-associated FAD-dependent desaturase
VTRVAVIGAGWSGLACALELTRRGQEVVVYEAAPQPGGRARAVRVALGDREFMLDNGQHLLIGAYAQTLRLAAEAGVDAAAAFLRLPFEMRYPDGVCLRAPALPAPLHMAVALATARGLDWSARRSALAFALRWRRRRWQAPADAPADTLFADAPPPLVRRMWRPLCLAALNVELADASAQVLLNVLRDSLAGGSSAADLLLPRGDLTRSFAGPAASRLAQRGAQIRLRSPVQRLARSADGWQVSCRDRADAAAAVVLALPPDRAADLLASAARPELDAAVTALRSVRSAPIATVYLRYPDPVRLPRPLLALLDDPAAGRFGQWVFDRGQLDADHAGVLSVVVSAAAAALQQGAQTLASRVAAQLRVDLGLPEPVASAVIAEKRATIVPAPGLRRPPSRLPLPGLYLAGDAAESDYPSTLEGSVRAGVAAAVAAAGDLAAR